MPDYELGVFLITLHAGWSDASQQFVGKFTLQFNTPLGIFRKTFEISAGDIIQWVSLLMGAISAQATAHSLSVPQFSALSPDQLRNQLTLAATVWPAV